MVSAWLEFSKGCPYKKMVRYQVYSRLTLDFTKLMEKLRMFFTHWSKISLSKVQGFLNLILPYDFYQLLLLKVE